MPNNSFKPSPLRGLVQVLLNFHLPKAAKRPGLTQALGNMKDVDAETLKSFFLCENGSGICDHIVQLIEQHHRDGARTPQHIDLNVFEIDIDHSAGTVVLQEIISPCRDMAMPLQEFLARLRAERRI